MYTYSHGKLRQKIRFSMQKKKDFIGQDPDAGSNWNHLGYNFGHGQVENYF